MTSLRTAAGALLLTAWAFCKVFGQTSTPAQAQAASGATATPLAFQVVSIKPAPPGSLPIVPAFMRYKGVSVRGLQRMAAPVWMTIAYAYQMQMNEALAAVRNQPSWVKNRVYTETFRADGEPTRDQVREMMRTMLADRFGLKIHEFTRQGTVNKLVMNKPGVLGPKIKPHQEGASCSPQEAASVGTAPDPSTPPVTQCGFVWYYLPGRVLHVGMTDMTIEGAATSLAGIGVGELDTRPVMDATGLSGRYDLTIEFRPNVGSLLIDPEADDGDVPSLIRAMKDQLGIRVESGEGPVRVVMIDHLSEPTPD